MRQQALILALFMNILNIFVDSQAISQVGKRPFTINDSFERTELVELNYDGNVDNPFLFSADGQKIFFITSNGDTDAMTYHFKLMMYDVSEIHHYLKVKNSKAPRPTVLTETKFRQKTLGMSYYPDDRGIKLLTLTNDPDVITFISADRNQIQQLYRANIKTMQVEQLTSLPTHVTNFVILEKRNEALVTVGDYTSQDDHCREPSYSILKRRMPSTICFETGESLYDKWLKDGLNYPPAGAVKLYKIEMRPGAVPILLGDNLWIDYNIRPKRLILQVDSRSPLQSIFPSPNQSKVLLRTFTNKPPENLLRKYRELSLGLFQDVNNEVDDYTHVSSMSDFYSFYTLIDLENSTSKHYIDLPIIPHVSKFATAWPDPVWSDERTVFIPELFPLSDSAGSIMAKSVAASSGRGTWIDTEDHRYQISGTPSFELVANALTAGQRKPQIATHPMADDMVRACNYPDIEVDNFEPLGCYIEDNKKQLRLFTGESHTSLPNIYAKDLSNGTTKLLFELNPQLKQVAFAQFKSFITKDEKGQRVGVAVFLPPNYTPGTRYPVVVGGNEFDFEKFPFEGPGNLTVPYATQALANNDIIVMYNFRPQGENSPYPEPRALRARAVNAGLRLLDQKEMIDLSKIGMIGYSATGSFVFDMALRPEYPVEALIVSDAFSLSPLGYLWVQYFPYPSIEGLDVYVCGAKPWGKTRTEWIERNPYFNLDKLNSAVLIHENWSGLTDWLDIIFGLQRLKKPVDALLFRSGQHPVIEAYNRYSQHALTVDWFNFWLNDVESDDPKKREQYERWRQLREMKRKMPKYSESTLPLSKMDCDVSSDSEADAPA